jgi:hypothetical protein
MSKFIEVPDDCCEWCRGMGSDPQFGSDVPCYVCGGSGKVKDADEGRSDSAALPRAQKARVPQQRTGEHALDDARTDVADADSRDQEDREVVKSYSNEDHGKSVYNARGRGYGSWASTPEDQRPAVRFRVKIEGVSKVRVDPDMKSGWQVGITTRNEDEWRLQLQEWLPRTRYGFLFLLVRPAGWYDMEYTSFMTCMGAKNREEAMRKADQLLEAQLASCEESVEIGTYYHERGGSDD